MFKYLVILIIAPLIGCRDKATDRPADGVGISDTIQYKRFFVEHKDTTWWNETIIHIPTDTLIDTSNSAFEEGNFNQRKEIEMYKIYFDRKAVIAFCDSLLKFIPLEESQYGRLFAERTLYEQIRQFAVGNQLGKIRLADALPTLLKRFLPLIIKKENGYRLPGLILKIENKPAGVWRHYYVINKNDTLLLSVGRD